ncbi:MAG TPA: GNAT family N-acetyltransferase [Candidatus Acidoferrum sp.]|nr:GNAT family N-acetyltransferase [Candidatus Acidoferrum sp.]
MKIFTLDPLRDPRWECFVERHPRASIFHTRGWLEALQRTYRYQPVVYTTASQTEELRNGIVLCRIESWLTGRRLVSLPFSDHCEPLVDTKEEWESLVASLIDAASSQHCKYVEMRPMGASELISADENGMARYRSFYFHTLDIRSVQGDLFQSFHRKAVQQPIKRAEREKVSSEEGRSPELVRCFYRLLIRTRRRHAVPPQPLKWFQNLVDCLGRQITIRVASKAGEPIASILTLSFNKQLYYKYGCTDERFHNLGGIQLLLWEAIRAEKQRGARVLDMGRSDIEQANLVKFKERWGSTRTVLTYYRHPEAHREQNVRTWPEQVVGYALARLPDSVLTAVGGLLYPHMG